MQDVKKSIDSKVGEIKAKLFEQELNHDKKLQQQELLYKDAEKKTQDATKKISTLENQLKELN